MIAHDLDEPQDALRPRLVAAAAMAALTSLEGSFDDNAEQRVPVAKAEALAVLDDAMLVLRGGLDALQDRWRKSVTGYDPADTRSTQGPGSRRPSWTVVRTGEDGETPRWRT